MVLVGNNATLEYIEPLPALIAIPLAAVLLVIIVVTIVGNTLVIYAIVTHSALRLVQNYFLISLAVADLSVGAWVMGLALIYDTTQYWPLSHWHCLAWITVDVMCCTASIVNLCAIALDRYLAISRPIWYAEKRTPQLVCTIIAAIWITSAIISLPPLLGWNDFSPDHVDGIFGRGLRTCRYSNKKAYIVYSASGSFYIPFIVMVATYGQVYRVAKFRLKTRRTRQQEMAKKLQNHLHNQSIGIVNNTTTTEVIEPPTPVKSVKSIKMASLMSANALLGENVPSVTATHLKRQLKISLAKERKAARTLGVIMGLFVGCWLPFFLMYVIVPFCVPYCSTPPPLLFSSIVWLGYINSTMNPIVYTIFNNDFRTAFYKVLQALCCRDRRTLLRH